MEESSEKNGLPVNPMVTGCECNAYKTFKRCPGRLLNVLSQPAFTCSKLTIETLKQGVTYVQS